MHHEREGESHAKYIEFSQCYKTGLNALQLLKVKKALKGRGNSQRYTFAINNHHQQKGWYLLSIY